MGRGGRAMLPTGGCLSDPRNGAHVSVICASGPEEPAPGWALHSSQRNKCYSFPPPPPSHTLRPWLCGQPLLILESSQEPPPLRLLLVLLWGPRAASSPSLLAQRPLLTAAALQCALPCVCLLPHCEQPADQRHAAEQNAWGIKVCS